MKEINRFVVTTMQVVAFTFASWGLEARASEGGGTQHSEAESSRLRVQTLAALTEDIILTQLTPGNGQDDAPPESAVDTGVRFFLSPDGSHPQLANPTVNVAPGDSFSLYLWAQLPEDLRIPAMAFYLIADSPSPLDYSGVVIDNPSIPMVGERWSDSTRIELYERENSMDWGILLIKVGGGLDGALHDRDPLYDDDADAFRMLRYDFLAREIGEADIYLGPGFLGIAAGRPNDLIHYGFGDDPVGNISYDTPIRSALPEATIRILSPEDLRVPEPATSLILIALAGPLALRRRVNRGIIKSQVTL